jgi:hypothetical protein
MDRRQLEHQEPVLGIESRRNLGGALDVGEEHRDELPLPGEVAVGDDLVDDLVRSSPTRGHR